MGMFDRIWVNCPNCGTLVEFQSKAGECILHDYNIYNIPAGIADDIKNDAEMCEKCGEVVSLYVKVSATVVPYIN